MESIEAVLSIKDLKAVVVGKILSDRMAVFEERFGKDFKERVFFTGQVKQAQNSSVYQAMLYRLLCSTRTHRLITGSVNLTVCFRM